MAITRRSWPPLPPVRAPRRRQERRRWWSSVTPPRKAPALAFQVLVALAVIAAAFLDPFKAAVAVRCFVGIVLIEASVHARLACGFLRIFRRDGVGENNVPAC